MMQERDYQTRALDVIRRATENTCLESPTGSGKGFIMGRSLLDPVRQIVFTHRRVLMRQLSDVLTSHGVGFGIRAAGVTPDFDAPIQLALYQSENVRVFKSKEWAMHHNCQRVHWDEAHALQGPVATGITRAYESEGAVSIGYSATPRGVERNFKHVYKVVSVAELMARGLLVQPRVFTPLGPDLDQLAKVKKGANGEYSPKALGKYWSPEPIFGKVLENWRQNNPERRPTALYAGGIRESLWFAKSLFYQGVRAAHIDAKNIWLDGELYPADDDNRRSILNRLCDGRIEILCNCQVLEIGWDMPSLGCVMLTHPIGSRVKFVQICGRGLRSEEGKEDCLYLDFAGNFWKHPALDSDEPWDTTENEWAAKVKADPKEFEPICCRNCGFLRVSGTECPNCGEEGQPSTRQVLQLNGTLTEVKGPMYKPDKPGSIKTPEQKAWESAFWGCHKSGRTFSQALAWAKKKSGLHNIPFGLKFMPKNASDWSKPVNSVPFKELF